MVFLLKMLVKVICHRLSTRVSLNDAIYDDIILTLSFTLSLLQWPRVTVCLRVFSQSNFYFRGKVLLYPCSHKDYCIRAYYLVNTNFVESYVWLLHFLHFVCTIFPARKSHKGKNSMVDVPNVYHSTLYPCMIGFNLCHTNIMCTFSYILYHRHVKQNIHVSL